MNKCIAFSRKDVDTDKRTIAGWISTEELDFHGDVLLARDVDYTEYMGYKSLTTFHRGDQPVGHCVAITPHPGKGVWGRFYIGRTKGGNEALLMIREEIINAFSIEADPDTIVAGPPTPEERHRYGKPNKDFRRVWRSWTLTGVAIVPQPANSGALISEKSMGRVQELLRDGSLSPSWAKRFSIGHEPKKFRIPWDGAVRMRAPVLVASA